MSAHSCMQELGIDRDKVRQCLGTRHSTRLTVQHGRLSKRRSLKRKYVPWVVVNGRHEELDEQHDLVKPLCAALREPRPRLCRQATPPLAMAAATFGAQGGAAPPTSRARKVCWQPLGHDEDAA